MHRTLSTAAVILTGMAFATGCSSSSTQNSAAAGALGNSYCAPGTVCGTTVAYGMLGPAADAPSEGYFFFGAGDALGEEVFTYYVASIRAQQEEYYATGENFFPGVD